MIGKFLCPLRDGNHTQACPRPPVHICWFDFFACSTWFLDRGYYRTADFGFHYHMPEHTRFLRIFAEAHNVEKFAIHPLHQSRFSHSAGNPSWVGLATILLLRIPSPPVFAYYNGLAFGRGYSPLIDDFPSSEFFVCTKKTFSHGASWGFTNTFQSTSKLQPGVLYSVALPLTVIKLVKVIAVCSIIGRTRF